MRKMLLLTLIIMLLAGCDGIRGNSRSYRIEKETKYLAEHSMPIEIDKLEPTKALMNEEIKDKRIFLTGEIPGVSGNSELEKHFFEVFEDNISVNHLILELPYSAGFIMNDYMVEEDDHSLDLLFNSIQGRPFATEENRSMLRQIKLYVKSRNKTLNFIGVDIEYSPELTLEYLGRVLEKHSLETFPTAAELAEARKKGFAQHDYLKLTTMKFLEELEKNEADSKQVFGDDYDELIHVLSNLKLAYDTSDSNFNESFDHERSERLVKNFLRSYDKDPEGIYFGQLANPAIMQKTHMDFDWFASAIQNERDSIKGNVVTFLYTYEDCRRNVFIAGKPEVENLDLFKFDDKHMKNAISQRYTIISLNGEDSPFYGESVIFEKDFSGEVAEYFQYLVVMNGAQASQAYKAP